MNKLTKPVIFKALAVAVLAYGLFSVGFVLAERNSPNTEKVAVTETVTAEGVLAVVNDERAKVGSPALKWSEELMASAETKCKDMAAGNYFDHVNPKTGKHGYEYARDALPEAKYVSENLTAGDYMTNNDVVEGWKLSKAHKTAMLDAKYTQTGLATCHVPMYPDRIVVVEHFATV